MIYALVVQDLNIRSAVESKSFKYKDKIPMILWYFIFCDYVYK